MNIHVKYVPGYNGGRFESVREGEKLRREDLPEHLLVRIPKFSKSEWIPAKPLLTNGVDHDHGHAYSWTALDFQLELQTTVGISLKKSLRELMRERGFTRVWLDWDSRPQTATLPNF